jgi:hypothetical protein
VLFKLLGLPFTLPAAGIRYCLDKVIEIAELEANSEEPVKQELLELQIALEEGTIDDRAYRAREAVLLARLRELREHQRELVQQQMDEDGEGSGTRVLIELPEELR